MLTIQDLFGASASQNHDYLIIKKSDLGLLSTVNSSAESLFVAILLKALDNFQGYVKSENDDKIISGENQPIKYENLDVYDCAIFLWNSPRYAMRRGSIITRNTLVLFTYAN